LEKDSSEFNSPLISNRSVGGSHDGRGDATSGTLPTPKPNHNKIIKAIFFIHFTPFKYFTKFQIFPLKKE